MLKYYVKGGPANGGQRGFIIPAINRDAAPMENVIAGFGGAVGMLTVAFSQRVAGTPPNMPPRPEAGSDRVAGAQWELEAAFGLLAADLGGAARLLDRRLAENPARTFGAAPTAAWTAFRMAAPAQAGGDAAARQFIENNQPAAFYPKGEPPLGSDDAIPLAQEKMDR
jgi:hypothetical protein